MTSGRSIGSALVLLVCCLATMASTASADDPRSSGRTDPRRDTGRSTSSNYLPEILRSEGLNDFDRADIGSVSAAHAREPTTSSSSRTCRSPTDQVGCSPTGSSPGATSSRCTRDANLAPLLGTSAGRRARRRPQTGTCGSTRARAPGAGITNEVIQYHGSADHYALNGAAAIANLWSSASSPTGNPAVSLRDVGATAVRPRPSPSTSRVGHSDAPGQPGLGRHRSVTAARRSASDDLFFGGAAARLARPHPGRHPSGRRAAAAAGQPHHRDGAHADAALLVPAQRATRRPSCSPVTITAATAAAARRPALPHDVAAKPSCSAAELANWDCVRSTSYTTRTPG